MILHTQGVYHATRYFFSIRFSMLVVWRFVRAKKVGEMPLSQKAAKRAISQLLPEWTVPLFVL